MSALMNHYYDIETFEKIRQEAIDRFQRQLDSEKPDGFDELLREENRKYRYCREKAEELANELSKQLGEYRKYLSDKVKYDYSLSVLDKASIRIGWMEYNPPDVVPKPPETVRKYSHKITRERPYILSESVRDYEIHYTGDTKYNEMNEVFRRKQDMIDELRLMTVDERAGYVEITPDQLDFLNREYI